MFLFINGNFLLTPLQFHVDSDILEGPSRVSLKYVYVADVCVYKFAVENTFAVTKLMESLNVHFFNLACSNFPKNMC